MQGKSFFFRSTSPFPPKNAIFPSGKAVFPTENPFWTALSPRGTDKFSMSFQVSFKQILREKMGATTPFTPQNEDSILGADPAHLAYLLGKIERRETHAARGNYPAPRVRPQRKPHTFSNEQRLSFDFLKTLIQDLSEGFTATELKRAYRRAALQTHPDHGGSVHAFMALKEHYETLQGLVQS